MLLEVRHLRKSYGQHLAVEDVSFTLNAGEVLGLLGPNGAGKSTTMAMIAGLLPPDAGDVLLDGAPFNYREPGCRRDLGLVPQELAIYPELSGTENLRFFGRLYGLRGTLLDERVRDVLAGVGLTDTAHKPSREYSGGMQRRLNFGIALLHAPRILILDEPTVGVDPQSRAHLLDCVRNAAAAGVGVIYASHYMEEVQSICQRVAIIDRGRMLAYDAVDHLLAGLAADLFLHVSGPPLNGEYTDLARVETSPNGQSALVIDGRRQDRDAVLRTLLSRLDHAGVQIERIETQQSNLERLFLQLTGNRLRD